MGVGVGVGVTIISLKRSSISILPAISSTVLLIFIDAGIIQFEVKSSWVDLLQLVLITVIGAYFGGRSLEKVKK